MEKLLPILSWARCYRSSDLRGDVVAALTVAVMLIPQGMAVSMLAGLPPIMGLYASVVPLLLYAIFGSSRHLHVGPVAIVSLLVASSIGDLADPGTAKYIAYATALAGIVGFVQIALGITRFGFIVNFLSHPVISGFTSAAAVIIGLGQIKPIIGSAGPVRRHIDNSIFHFFDQFPHPNLPTIAIGVSALLILILLRRWRVTFPRALVVVVASTFVVWAFGLDDMGVDIIGRVPRGMPPLAIPDVELATLGRLAPIGVAIALVAFMESVAVAKKYASECGYEVDGNQELIGLGMANLGAFGFGGYPVTGSFARTAVNVEAGARTGLASIITSATVALTLLFLTHLFYYLPAAVLAAIIIEAVSGLIDVAEARHLYRVKRMDLGSLIFTFVATLALGVELGLLISILVSSVLLIRRTTHPHWAVLGRLPGTRVYRNIERYPEARTVGGVLMIRFDSSLYFANANYLKEVVLGEVRAFQGELKAVVFDASSINDIDSSADTVLHEIAQTLTARGVNLCFSNIKGPVRDVLMRSGLYEQLGEKHFFFRNHDAIESLIGVSEDVPNETQADFDWTYPNGDDVK